MSLLDPVRLAVRGLAEYRVRNFGPGPVAVRQRRRLRRLLHHAAAHSPFYRARFRGLDLGRCLLTDLPVVTKPELVDHFDAVVTDRQVRRADVERFTEDPANGVRLFRGRYHVTHTSGSSGQSLLVLQEPHEMELLFLLQFTRGNVSFGNGPAELLGRLRRPACLVAITPSNPFNSSRAVWAHVPAGLRRFAEVVRIDSTDPELVAKLERHRPTNLSANPSLLDPLALRPAVSR